MENNENNNPALVSMILGIISVVLCWVPLIGLALGIIAIVLAIKGFNVAKTSNKGRGFAIAGVSCGAVGIVLSIIYTIMWIFMGAVFKWSVDTIDNELKNPSYNSTYINRSYEYDYNTNSILKNYYNY